MGFDDTVPTSDLRASEICSKFNMPVVTSAAQLAQNRTTGARGLFNNMPVVVLNHPLAAGVVATATDVAAVADVAAAATAGDAARYYRRGDIFERVRVRYDTVWCRIRYG